jgi:CheY-like chemotaxis protein
MRTVLVIDDNKSVCDSMRMLLQQRGYIGLSAANGSEGLALAETHVIDGALIDIHMPGLNGIEVCRTLRDRALASGREISLWVMTGARTAQLTKASIEAGAIELLGKPFDVAELFRRFEERWGPPPPKPEPTDLDALL